MDFRNVNIRSVKNYWNNRPCNLRHSNKPIGTVEYFNEVEKRKYFVEPHIKDFASFDAYNGKKVLEIGCGIGTDTVNFVRAGAILTAVDVSERSIDLTQKRLQLFNLTNEVELLYADAESLTDYLNRNKVSNFYDLVYSFGVLHHTPNPDAAFREIAKCISHNGVLKVMVYYRYSTKVFALTRGRIWRDDIVAKQSEAETGCPVTYTYSKKSFKKLLAKCGFEILEAKVDHIFPYDVKKYVDYKYSKRWYWKIIPDKIFRRIEKKLGWHLCVTAKLSSSN